MKEIDWSKYPDQYPDRYLKDSKIDVELQRMINEQHRLNGYVNPVAVLDIGGGVDGSPILQQVGVKAFFLDINVNMPEWYERRLTWGQIEDFKFDIIHARNSFNYMTELQLKMLPDLLNQGGIFIANTFIKPKKIQREFTNSKTGVKGFEQTHLKDGMVTHTLYIHDTHEVIRHSFHGYNIKKIIRIFENEKLSFEITSKSSMIVKIKR